MWSLVRCGSRWLVEFDLQIGPAQRYLWVLMDTNLLCKMVTRTTCSCIQELPAHSYNYHMAIWGLENQGYHFGGPCFGVCKNLTA